MLVAVVIGLTLVSVLTEIYLVNQKSLRLQTALYAIQDNAKSAISILSKEIHQAGNIGCTKLSSDFPLIPFREYSVNKITGTVNEIKLSYAEYPNAFLIQPMSNNKVLCVRNNIHFSKGDVLLISNCKRAEIFLVDKVRVKDEMQEITVAFPLHDSYEKNSEVSRLVMNKYFVAKTGRMHGDKTPVYALFLEDIHHRKLELVEDVNLMRITYADNSVAIDLNMDTPPIKKTWHMYVAL